MDKKFKILDELNITDDDIKQSMKNIGGYFDVTLDDFKNLYHEAILLVKERILSTFTAQDLMTSAVLSVYLEDDLQIAITKMGENKISGLAVLDKTNKLVGMISEKDIFKLVNADGSMAYLNNILNQCNTTYEVMHNLIVKDIMSSRIITTSVDTQLKTIIDIFQREQINRLPVVGENNTLLGIIARSDIIKAFSLLS